MLLNVICLGGTECLFTSLDLDRVCSEVMTAKSPCLVGTSDDAGRLFVFVTCLLLVLVLAVYHRSVRVY